jgi:hypothetical protein
VEAYNGEAKFYAKRSKENDHSTAMSGKILTEKMTKVQFQVGLSLQW